MQQYYTRNNNIHSFTVTVVCDKHVKSSADVASLSRRLCSAPADLVAMSESPTQKWEISICNLWNVKLEKLLGDEAAVILTVLSDALL